jgi:hypothetical protein
LISQGIESNDSIHSPSRALIGGVQPKHGWWAPVAALYKEVGAEAHNTRFDVLPIAPPTPLSDLRLALVTGSSAATTHPRPRHHPSPWPPARLHQAMVQVTPLSLSDLSVSLSQIPRVFYCIDRKFTERSSLGITEPSDPGWSGQTDVGQEQRQQAHQHERGRREALLENPPTQARRDASTQLQLREGTAGRRSSWPKRRPEELPSNRARASTPGPQGTCRQIAADVASEA